MKKTVSQYSSNYPKAFWKDRDFTREALRYIRPTSVAFSDITRLPDTLSGYGITDGESVSNKATDFLTSNDTLYPSVKAVISYVSTAIAVSNPTIGVKIATKSALSNSPKYDNGAAGVGATLTATTNGTLSISGYAPSVSDRILVRNQSNAAHNGIYTVISVGSAGSTWELERSTDYDEVAHIEGSGVIPSDIYIDEDNDTQTNVLWLLTTSITNIGVDSFVFTQYTIGSDLVAKNTLPLSQFAATTSAELAGVLSDETGYSTGARCVFSINPSFAGLSIDEATNIVLGTTTGTKIGTSTSQKLGFFNSTPVVQQSGNLISGLQALGLVVSGSISLSDISALFSTANTWTAAQRSSFTTATDGVNITLDFSASNNFRVTLGGNRTLAVPTNIGEGQSGVINVFQDGTGSRTLSYAWPFMFASGVAPTLSTGKYTIDQLVYMVNRYATSTVTISNATPAVITWNSHGLTSGQRVQFTTTGSLPTGLTTSTTYWVYVVDANTFRVSTSLSALQAGTYVATSSAGSGTHTATCIQISITSNIGLA